MKFKAIKKNALPILKEASKAVDARSATSILRHMLLIADEERGKVRVIAYNNLIHIESAFDAEVEEGGKIAILGNFITTLELSNGDDFTVSLKEGQVRASIKTGTGQYQISVMDPVDFPDSYGIQKEGSHVIATTTKKIGDLVERTMSAPDVKDERMFVQGVNIKTEGNRVSFTGVNAQMMVRAFAEEKNMDYGNIQVTVYKSVLENLKSILPSVDIPINVIINDKKIMFEFMDTKLVARLIEINYPDKQVTDKINFINESKSSIVVSVSELLSAVKCIMNISYQDLKRHDIVLKIKENTMTVTSDTDVAFGEETINILQNDGGDFTCCLNGSNLNKCLSTFKGDKVKIQHRVMDNGKGVLGIVGESTDRDKDVVFILILMEYNK